MAVNLKWPESIRMIQRIPAHYRWMNLPGRPRGHFHLIIDTILQFNVISLKARTGAGIFQCSAGLQPCLEPLQYGRAKALRYALS